MDSCQVGVLEESHKISLSCLLESQHSTGLEAQVSLEILGNFTYQPLERQLPDEQLGGLLVLSDLAKGHSSRSVPVERDTFPRRLLTANSSRVMMMMSNTL